MKTKRLIILGLGSWILASAVSLFAQQDQGSVVEAARKAQAERKNAPKAKIVLDNDNLYTLTGTINVVGQEPGAQDQTKGKAAGAKTPAASGEKGPAKDEAYWRQKFEDANRKLAGDQRELDILQREYNLKQQQFYADPMAALKQDYSRQELNDTKAKIDDKAAVVAQDKQDVANLEDELRQSGGDPGWASQPSQQQAAPPQPQAASSQPQSQPQTPPQPQQ